MDDTPVQDAAPAAPVVTPDQSTQLATLQSAHDGAASPDARDFVQSQIDALLASINQ